MNNRFARHAAASVIGLILALTALELALRLLGYASERKQGSPPQAEKSNVIVCVGDSLTYGIGASYETDYPGQLNAIYQRTGGKYTVINRGIAGANTARMLAEMPQILEKTRPAAVIAVCGLSNYWNLEHAWGLEGSALKNRLRDRLFKLRLYRLYAWRTFPHRTTGPETPAGQEPPLTPEMKRKIEATTARNPQIERWIAHDYAMLAALCKQAGVQLFLANYPCDNRYLRINPLIAKISAELRLPLIDNAAVFIELKKTDPDFDKKYLVQDGHGSDAGYAKIAENAYRILSSHNFK